MLLTLAFPDILLLQSDECGEALASFAKLTLATPAQMY